MSKYGTTVVQRLVYASSPEPQAVGRVVLETDDRVDRHLRGIGSLLRFFDAPLLDVLRLREATDRAVQAPLVGEVVAQIEARTHLRVIAVVSPS